MAATEADVQLFWGEPLDGIAERIDRLTALTGTLGRVHAPLQFGLRITTLVRDTPEEAWRDAEAKVERMAGDRQARRIKDGAPGPAVGQQRLLDLAARGEVLDTCLYTAPGKFGGGGAGTTWLVGSYDEVADALRRYAELGITHFVLSDTPYKTEVGPGRRRAAQPAARPGRCLRRTTTRGLDHGGPDRRGGSRRGARPLVNRMPERHADRDGVREPAGAAVGLRAAAVDLEVAHGRADAQEAGRQEGSRSYRG